MTDFDRLLIILLLGGIFYIIYKFQHLMFGSQYQEIVHQQSQKQKQKITNNQVSIDNISQFSLGSLDDKKFPEKNYKQTSILESFDSINDNTLSFGDVQSNNDLISRDS